jgi:hypothetical protein
VNMIHGLLPEPEWPGEAMNRYLAVSLHAKAKTVLVGGPSWDDIPLIPNFFDPRRFGKRRARRREGALIHSSRLTPAHLESVRSMLAAHGLSVEHLGYGGKVASKPETLLPRYDVVFAAAGRLSRRWHVAAASSCLTTI